MRKYLIAIILISISILSIIKIPENVYAYDLNISAPSYIITDQNGNALVSKNADEKREVASICKLMTSLIVLEKIDKKEISIDDMITISSKASMVEGSSAFLDVGVQYSVGELLKSVIVASANDSAVALAEFVSGSEYRFTDLMNLKAQQIGMNNTLYANSTGLTGNNQYSTAIDTCIVLNKISEYDLYKEYSKIWMDYLIHPSGRKTELVNTNRLIKYVDYCECGKTGFTDDAGYCLSSKGNINGMELTCVVLGCKNSASRFTDSINLYGYVRDHYSSVKIVDSSVSIDNDIKVAFGNVSHINIMPSENYIATIKNGDENNYRYKLDLPDIIKAPISRGDIIGAMYVICGDDIVAKIDIVSNDCVARQKYGDIVKNLFEGFNKI